MRHESDHEELVDLLRHAYSGERAAALAYRGHWQSLPAGEDRSRIQEIEREEWVHRDQVGAMLIDLEACPSAWREIRAAIVGSVLGPLCRVTGWFAPMYGAGRLESANIREYERAAELALACGRSGFVECLLEMAEVEWEHERWFRSRVESHALASWIPLWPQPSPKDDIRRAFARRRTRPHRIGSRESTLVHGRFGPDRAVTAQREDAPARSRAGATRMR